MYRSPEFMPSCINMYLLETGKAPCSHKRLQVRQITFVYTIFAEGSAQTTLISNQQFDRFELYDDLQSPVGQSREEDKDQELIHDAAWYCPV